MWDMVIEHHRANGDNRQIEMLYTDLASNDFSTLFRMMQGMQGDPAHAYQNRYENVFVHGHQCFVRSNGVFPSAEGGRNSISVLFGLGKIENSTGPGSCPANYGVWGGPVAISRPR